MSVNILLKSKQIPLEFQVNPKKFKKYHKIKDKVSNVTTTTKKEVGYAFILNKHTNLNLKQILVILKLLKPALKSFRSSRISLNAKIDTILTKKPKDIRMGRGKGAPAERVCSMRAGKPFFSLYGISSSEANKVMSLCKSKLKIISIINKYK
jgi:ribosomal protein L16/L10AE